MASSEFSLVIISVLQIGLMLYAVYQAYKNKYQIRPTILLYPPIFAIGIIVSIAAGCALVMSPLGIALGIGAYLGFVHPAYGLSIFLANLIMRPWETLYPGNRMEILPRALALVCVLGWIFTKMRERDSRIIVSKVFIVFLAFAGWLFVSAAVSFNSSEPLSFVFGAMLPAAVIMFIVANSVRSDWSIELLLSTLVTSVFGVALVAILETYVRNPGWGASVRLQSFGQWGNANDLALLLVTALPLLFFRTSSAKSSLSKRNSFRFVLIAVLLGALWTTQSRGAFIALAASLLPMFYDNRQSRKTYLLLIASAAVFLGLLLFGISRDQEDMSGSETARFNYVITGLRMLKAFPLTGVGPSNYPLLYDQYTADYTEGGERTAHSSWVLVLSESGPPGFLLFFILVAMGLRATWKSRKVYPQIVCAYIAYFTAATFLSQTYSILTFLLICLGIAANKAKSETAN